jgi:hypothetical protein
MKKPISVEQFCFRYMWPCVDIRWSKHQISEKDYLYLRSCRDNPELIPSREILFRCFPDASRDIEALGTARNRDPWSIENLSDYWHHHHEGVSPVDIFRVIDTNIDGFIVVPFGAAGSGKSGQGFLFNSFDLDADAGSLIYGHAYHATEKIGS